MGIPTITSVNRTRMRVLSLLTSFAVALTMVQFGVANIQERESGTVTR